MSTATYSFLQNPSAPLCKAINNLENAAMRNKPMQVPMTGPTREGTQEANQTASWEGMVAWKYIFLYRYQKGPV